MDRRHGTLVAIAVAAATFAACSGGGGGGGSGFQGGGGLVGVVYDYTDRPARGVRVRTTDASGTSTTTGSDGRFALSLVPGTHVLEIGDGVLHPTLHVAVATSQSAGFLPRPVYVPSLESGTRAGVPTFVTAATSVVSSAVEGASLELGAGATVTYPAGVPTTVSIVGVAPSRLPRPLPGGLVPRAAYLVEPAGLKLSQATLAVPLLEDAAQAPFDVWRLDPATGDWRSLAVATALGVDRLQCPISDGGLYAVASRNPAPSVTLRGRVVSGARPVAGYRVEAWNLVSDATSDDGLFTIPGVPSAFGAYVLRAFPERPGVDFAPELAIAFTGATQAGDIAVLGAPVDTIAPRVVSTVPDDKATNVAFNTQVVVKFSEPIDPSTLGLRVSGTAGPADGVTLFDAPFQARFIPANPLTPADTYYVVVGDRTMDLAGNTIDTKDTTKRFTIAAGTPPPLPTDTLAFALSPLRVAAGDVIAIRGRNFPGATTVKVGASVAPPVSETTDQVEARTPDFEPALDQAVSLTAAGQSIPTLAPLVVDLRATVASLSSGIVPRRAPPAELVAQGRNVANGSVLVDGVGIASVDTTSTFAGQTVVSGRLVQLATPAPSNLLTGPVVVRGPNGRPGLTYRFLQVRD